MHVSRTVPSLLAAVLAAGAVALPARAAGTPAPPVIHESFTVLPCPAHPVSTLAIEGCTEKSILAGDRAIDTRARAIFSLLAPSARSEFVDGESSWLRYRAASCASGASRDAGGTLQPVAYGTCVVSRNRTHLEDLSDLVHDLRSH
jgi:uncharacterized protein YecT (DUF1311 family)